MEFIVLGVVCYLAGLATAVGAMRRAAKKPFGKTAKLLAMLRE